MKPVLRGLLDRSGAPPAALAGVMGGYVVNVHWADIQPVQGGPLVSNNAIDQAIAEVRHLNAGGAHLGLKVRLFVGVWAPDWAKGIDGAPVPVIDPSSGTVGTIGRFWTEDFGRAYSELQTKLAARYDAVPEIREVTVSRCTTVFAEPLIRDISDPATVAALLAAGYSFDADRHCQQEAVLAHAPWATTRSDLALNPYQAIQSDGTTLVDEPFTAAMIDFCRSQLGPRCVLENNSLRAPPIPTYASMYAKMQATGPPITFQTATLRKVGSLEATLDLAISMGATSVELPSGFESMAAASLAPANDRLAANPSS